MNQFKCCENCAKNGVCRSATGDVFGFCRSGFVPCESYSVWRTVKARDEYGLPYVFTSACEWGAWQRDEEAYDEEVEKITVSAKKYEVLPWVLMAAEDIDPYQYDAEQVRLDGAVSAMINGGEELQGLIDWLEENGWGKAAEAVKEAWQ